MTRKQSCAICGEKYDLIVEWWWFLCLQHCQTFLDMNQKLKLRAPGQSHVLWRLQGGYFSCWLGQSFLKTNNEHRNWFGWQQITPANHRSWAWAWFSACTFRFWATVGWGYAFTFQCFWPYHWQEPHGHLCMFRGEAVKGGTDLKKWR